MLERFGVGFMRFEHSTATIVVLGTFRPDAYRLKALIEAKILSTKEGELAEMVTLVPGQIVNFETSWASVLVEATRFQVIAREAPYIRACDFVVKALNDIDSKFGISAIGINFESHVEIQDSKVRDAIGMSVAPPKAWGRWGAAIVESMTNDLASRLHGGAMTVTMRLPFLDEKVGGWRDVTISPSGIFNEGIQFRTNHHHILASAFQDSSMSPNNPPREDNDGVLLGVLAERFDGSIAEAEEIFAETLTQ